MPPNHHQPASRAEVRGASVRWQVGPYVPSFEGQVLDLINADRLPGQPVCTSTMLAQALSGDSPIDGGWWAELDRITVKIARDATGAAAGVISYAYRPRDATGLVLWLHAREHRTVVEALIDHALAELSFAPAIDAFDFATALGLGLEALPVRHRHVTHSVLLDRGFDAEDLWRYMRRDLPAELPTAPEAQVMPSDDKDGWKIEIKRGADRAAEAVVGRPVDGIGVLWWIEVEPPYEGSGLGKRLLGEACHTLAEAGAREVILYVDDDDPKSERSRVKANRLYTGAGFSEIDRLYSYKLRR